MIKHHVGFFMFNYKSQVCWLYKIALKIAPCLFTWGTTLIMQVFAVWHEMVKNANAFLLQSHALFSMYGGL